jgi:hypothetical protein
MEILSKALLCLAAIAFALAVVGALFSGNVMGVVPEALSRACSNLALISIGIVVIFGKSRQQSA